MEQRKHIDFVGSLVFLALSVYMVIEGIRYHQDITRRMALAFYESPGFFPVIVGSVMFVCSLMLLVRSTKGGALGENLQKLKDGASALMNKDMLFACVGIAIMGLYIFIVLPFLGFLLASIIFLVGIMLYLKAGHWAKILLIAISIVGISVAVVSMIFRAPLPGM